MTITSPRTDTQTLLTALVISSPLWAVVALAQAATRDGFDLTRHPLSMLSTGSLGWLQITNFIVAGTLAVVGAVGLSRGLDSRWIPRLVAVYGTGYVLSGVFSLDPGDGFPAGIPLGPPDSVSWHAVLHLRRRGHRGRRRLDGRCSGAAGLARHRHPVRHAVALGRRRQGPPHRQVVRLPVKRSTWTLMSSRGRRPRSPS